MTTPDEPAAGTAPEHSPTPPTDGTPAEATSSEESPAEGAARTLGASRGSGARRPRLLLYAMYDPATLDSAPKVRITRLSAALRDVCDLEVVSGDRRGRSRAVPAWLLRRGLGRVEAVYVESASSTATITDIWFLALARLRGRPVGIYFRDAYQAFRDLYPRTRRRHVLADWVWRLTTPILRTLATTTFAPSQGLADVLGLRRAVLLPPGTDPELPDLGAGPGHEVAYVGALGEADGFGTLVAAMTAVRGSVPDATLTIVGPPLAPAAAAALPVWVTLVQAGRNELPDVLRSARLCVIPRPVNRYSDLAVPVKLVDYLGFGKPIVATAARETRRIVESTGAGLVCPDTADGLAEALLRVLRDDELATRLAARARAAAESPAWTWSARARLIVSTLVPDAAGAERRAEDLATGGDVSRD